VYDRYEINQIWLPRVCRDSK